jgi:hypothetical protein
MRRKKRTRKAKENKTRIEHRRLLKSHLKLKRRSLGLLKYLRVPR